jgi:hypothetical protein
MAAVFAHMTLSISICIGPVNVMLLAILEGSPAIFLVVVEYC